MKYVICNTSMGQFKIPLIDIRKEMATYWSNLSDDPDFYPETDVWKKMVERETEDSEVIDWLTNKSTWSLWKDLAIKITDDIKAEKRIFWKQPENFKIVDIND